MTIEDELRSRLSEDPLENIIFLGDLIENDIISRKNNPIVLSFNMRENNLYKTYVLRKIYYEETVKAMKFGKIILSQERLQKMEEMVSNFKEKIRKYNREYSRNIPL